ncbi:MAG: glycosyl transferase family 1 [Flavobacteriales bacterium]|nr:MAG: glycosyl transferase family 1 [Flavobacteriales bacterium]
MKALIITYYWPPAGGPGVQRWLKFVKYLPEFGIEPVIYTAKNPVYPVEDYSLEQDIPEGIKVLRQPIWEPNAVFGKKKSKKSAGFLNDKPSFFGKLMLYVRANFFIPDSRKYWIKPSVKYLENYLDNNLVDVIITTGPPHSVHLIGLSLKQKLNVKWLADFRDPWTAIDYFHKLPLAKKSIKKHYSLEQEVVEKADAVTVVGKTMADSYANLNKNIYVISNGYDTPAKMEQITLDDNFSLVHIGSFNADRNHTIFWEAVHEICLENNNFKRDLSIKLIGGVAKEVLQDIKNCQLQKYTTVVPYLAHHEVIRHQFSAQVLLVLVNNVPSARGIVTGKIFEYLNTKRPVLAIGPTDGDLAEILKISKTGKIVGFEDKKQLKKEILSLYHEYNNGTLKRNPENIKQYHRKNLTESLSVVLRSIGNNKS